VLSDRLAFPDVSIVTTERLSLREMTEADLDDMAALLGDERVMTYYPRPKTRDEALGWINWNRHLYQDHGFGLWLVSLGGTGEFVGDCGLTMQLVDGVEEVEVGYHVITGHQRQGYATEAAAACRDLARDRFSVDRLIAIINPDNQPSRSVAERIGLRFEKHSAMYGEDRLIYATQLRAA
jgi:RimJ/RimL family protein N-acetyltransferase